MKRISLLVVVAFGMLINSNAQGLGGALKNRLEKEKNKAIENALGGKKTPVNVTGLPDDKPSPTQNDTQNGRPEQNGNSAGLTVSSKDIEASLNSASENFKTNSYKATKLALRQAMQGMDVILGNKLLTMLPKSVSGIAISENSDEVVCGSSTFVGLAVKREYLKNDTWVKFSVHSSAIAALANSAIGNGFYGNYNTNEQQQKSILVKNNTAFISFDASKGYTISIALGQQMSAFIEGVNIADEKEMMKIAESFDYDAMKKMFASSSTVNAADFETAVTNAKNEFKSDRLEVARDEVQQALNFVDEKISKEIMAVLPKEIGTFKCDSRNDNITGATGIAGLFIHRSWGDTAQVIDIDIISDSPIISGVNALISMPFVGALGNSSQKVIKVDGYKALLQKQSDQNADSGCTVQIPFGNAMITVAYKRGISESNLSSVLASIPVKKIVELAQ